MLHTRKAFCSDGVSTKTIVKQFVISFLPIFRGIEIVPLLEKIGAGETIINALGKPGIGHIAVAYLLYKLATPARYTVTVVGTQLTVKKLRQMGYMQPVRPEDSIRSLLKAGRSQFQER